MDRRTIAPVFSVLLAAFSTGFAAPFESNQNQYFLYVVARPNSELSADWLAQSPDPTPVFTALVLPVYEVSGTPGLVALALVANIIAFAGVFAVARLFSNRDSIGPFAAVAIAALSVSPLATVLREHLGVDVNVFLGVAGQYVIQASAYIQPSSAGVLLLAALPMWLTGISRDCAGPACGGRLFTAWSLAVVACAIHPTYLVVSVIGLGAGAVVELLTGGRVARVPRYVLASVSIGLVTVALNPHLISMATETSTAAWAKYRFAFERIPHHTLITTWEWTDALRFLFIIMVALHLREVARLWLGYWILVGAACAIASGLVVYLMRSASLAILFPWRISAILVPVAASAVTATIVSSLESRVRSVPIAGVASDAVKWIGITRWMITVILISTSVLALRQFVRQEPPATRDDLTRIVDRARPMGVGLIPLSAQYVRLNARAPIYVDWKSPPYSSRNLAEWWHRIDRVRAYEEHPEVFCSGTWSSGIDWILMDIDSERPSCLGEWRVADVDGGNVLLQR